MNKDNNNVIRGNINRQLKIMTSLNWQIEREVKTILEKTNVYKKDLVDLENLLIDLEITCL